MSWLKVTFPGLVVLFLIEAYLIFVSGSLSPGFTQFLEFQLWVIYGCSLIYFYRRDGVNSLFVLFLLCLALFNFQKIFLGHFINEDYRYADSLINIYLTEDIVQETLYIYSVFTYLICFFYDILSPSSIRRVEFTLTHDNQLFRTGKIVMLLFCVFAGYRSYLEFNALFGSAYTEFYTEEGIGGIPLVARLGSLIYQVGFMIILASVPKRRDFLIFSGLYLLIILPNLFTGLRATFAVSCMILFWYYGFVYKTKVKLTRIIIPALLFIFLLQVIANRRSNDDREMEFFDSVTTFFYQQSQSMYVLSLYIQFRDDLIDYRYPFLIDPLISWLFPSGQSVEAIGKRSAIGHQLTYTLNPSYYLSGRSLGTNFMAELYEFGLIGIIMGAFLFAYFIATFEKNVKKSRLLIFLSIIIVGYFFLAPRSTFFPSLYFLVRALVIYLLVLFLFKLNVKKYLSWK